MFAAKRSDVADTPRGRSERRSDGLVAEPCSSPRSGSRYIFLFFSFRSRPVTSDHANSDDAGPLTSGRSGPRGGRRLFQPVDAMMRQDRNSLPVFFVTASKSPTQPPPERAPSLLSNQELDLERQGHVQAPLDEPADLSASLHAQLHGDFVDLGSCPSRPTSGR